MGITLSNPVAAFTEKIAQPFDNAAPIVRQLSTLYGTANQQLQTNQQKLSATFVGLGATAFVDRINKQIGWVGGITSRLDDLAGFYETCASDVRAAAQAIEWSIEPYLDIAQWVLDRLTPDIVVQQGESAVHAVFSDMKDQLHREMSDAGGFFGNIVHLHFGAALHDAVDGVEGLAHLGGDVLAMVGAVEPILCQWAADAYQAVNWLLNKINSWALDVENWLFGLSDIAADTAVFVDPNSTSEEKWLAGADMGINFAMDIAMLIPGADVFAMAGKGGLKMLEKLGMKEAEDMILKLLEKVTLKELRQKIIQKILGMFSDKLGDLFMKIAAGDISKSGAVDILRGLVGKKVIPPIAITDAARKAIYDDLVKKFPDVDPNFIAHLVDANPGRTPLTEQKIENFLLKAKNRGELDYITLLYTYVYKSDRPGLDQLLRDIANGSPNVYKGSLYQLEWIAAHNSDVKAIEVLRSNGQHGVDVILNDGTYVDLKAYGGKISLPKLEKQISDYVRDFPDVKNHSLHFVFQSGIDGVSQATIDKIEQEAINYGRSKGVTVVIDLWPK